MTRSNRFSIPPKSWPTSTATSPSTKAGVIREGRLIADTAITLATNPTELNERWRVHKTDITSRHISELSSMPSGLLDAFQRDEILDLLAFLEFGE